MSGGIKSITDRKQKCGCHYLCSPRVSLDWLMVTPDIIRNNSFIALTASYAAGVHRQQLIVVNGQKWKSPFLDPHLTFGSLAVSPCSFTLLQNLSKPCKDNNESAHGDAACILYLGSLQHKGQDPHPRPRGKQ